MKRTHLPLNALRVFDAAARHLSFTRAADELAVTPAAVGQQIRALEDVLGVVLFRRTPKGLELTDEASAGLEALRSGFLHFEDAVRAMQAGQSSHVYTIAAPREFFAAWLAPRLAAFRKANPEVQFSMVADEEADFTEANLDLAVRWAEGPGELEGVALGEPGRVTVGQGCWISWPGDTSPEGDECEQPPLSVGDAGRPSPLPPPAWARPGSRCCWHSPGWTMAGCRRWANRPPAARATGWSLRPRSGGRRRSRRWWRF
jgi:LysR family glycine cleavage system transcriptional activator